MKQTVIVAMVSGFIGGMIGAAAMRALKSPTPAALSSRLDKAERKITTILLADETRRSADEETRRSADEEAGAWFCTPGAKCGRTESGCGPGCRQREIAYCGGLFGVDCYERLDACLARVDELQRAHDLDARMCIGVQ